MQPDIWVTSDSHFGHKKILDFCPDSRPFDSVEEMDEALIERWNEVVKPDDIIYHLGDFTWYKEAKIIPILERLNGQKHLVFGNHCHVMRRPSIRKYFEWSGEYKEIKVDGHKICLFHFPILYWNRQHYGSFHFHGHLHSNSEGIHLPQPFNEADHSELVIRARCKDVGADSNSLYPYNVRELIEHLSKVEVTSDNRPGRSVVR